MADYFVYIMSNPAKTLYVGMTNNLERRIYEHRNHIIEGFTARYNVSVLVYYESTPNVVSAIEREKQIKSWRREKKIALIEGVNPDWRDLSQTWGVDARETPLYARGDRPL